MTKRHVAIAGAILTLALAGGAELGASSLSAHAARPAQAHKTVTVKTVNGQYGFTPAKLTVKVGTKVTWTNVSDAPHTVTGTGSWKFKSKTFSPGQKVSFLFKKVGTYHYICSIHPYMKATVVVKK